MKLNGPFLQFKKRKKSKLRVNFPVCVDVSPPISLSSTPLSLLLSPPLTFNHCLTFNVDLSHPASLSLSIRTPIYCACCWWYFWALRSLSLSPIEDLPLVLSQNRSFNRTCNLASEYHWVFGVTVGRFSRHWRRIWTSLPDNQFVCIRAFIQAILFNYAKLLDHLDGFKFGDVDM